jgi:hypothetical protein
MKMEVLEVVENADGSATCTLELDAESVRFLINMSFVSILKDTIQRNKEFIDEKATGMENTSELERS